MMEKKPNPLFPILFVFVITTGFFVTAKSFLEKKGFDQSVLIIANLLIVAVTLFSFFLAKKNLTSSNPHAFVNGVYKSILVKLFICIAAAAIYIVMTDGKVNKPALFTAMALYLLYSFLEVSLLQRQLKEKKNGKEGNTN